MNKKQPIPNDVILCCVIISLYHQYPEHQHLTADEIYDKLSNRFEMPSMDKVTDTLEQLCIGAILVKEITTINKTEVSTTMYQLPSFEWTDSGVKHVGSFISVVQS